MCVCFFFKQKTAYEMRISDWSSDVCSSDLAGDDVAELRARTLEADGADVGDIVGRGRKVGLGGVEAGERGVHCHDWSPWEGFETLRELAADLLDLVERHRADAQQLDGHR